MTQPIEFSNQADAGNGAFAVTQAFQDIKEAAHEHLLTRIEELGAEFGRWSRSAIQRFVDLEVEGFTRMRRIPVNETEVREIAEALTKELAGFGPIEDLLADPAVEDILVNGHLDVYVSRHGVLERIPVRFADSNHLLRIVRRILAPIGRRLDESNPMVDARLPDGGRINVVIPPLALEGPVVSIRKFRKDPLKPEDLLGLGTMNEEIGELLRAAVKARCNILVSGGTSSGKTSLLNALAYHVPSTERVITIEDTAELSLNHPHVVRLESRPGGFEGTGVVTIRELLRNSLRMRPDRIIVGEVRGGEVLEMLQAMSTGHDGSMGTIHSSSPRECLYRLEMLAGFAGFQGSEVSLRRQITNAIDFIVQIGRLSNGKRRILSVTEITGLGDNIVSTQELYRYEPYIGPDGEEMDRWTSLGLQPHSPKLARMRNTAMDGGGLDVGFGGGGGRFHV
ncbi:MULTISPECIES: CpaF family protein [Ralstonia solanacearum species complex]|uniref:Secretion atpase protein n=3 Tax=Ralstonia solanacearum TaxID=305 RepID=A0A7U7PQZ1_RALSL|nr:CpaF family protein [Ralstonia solanacearum]ALF90600.1 Putative conjugal transfer protein [Ralstonia solanacearum]ATI30040.1 pilus assembly protein CpaF [Ralstonia solanacearum]EAP72594.1 Secretion ATPase; CpaF2 [Ralstonia solanacearum UW551]KEI32702.1 pilus assembly protein CpaF [Ralstonia solanacearum]KFX29361.1 pilus assembly protein CpaF [Ralstonia solanacearum]